MALSIRVGSIEEDRRELRDCLVALQDAERDFEPALPPGEVMADSYLDFLAEQCAQLAGHVLVAENSVRVVGFVCVLTRVPPQQPDEAQIEYAYITDLVVLSPYRRHGLGSNLIAHAEAVARDAGAKVLRIAVLARNQGAYQLYRHAGFADFRIELTKPL